MWGATIGECGKGSSNHPSVSRLDPPGAAARLEGVNKPELLPASYTPVIDVAGFLTDGEEARVKKIVDNLEADTGLKLRVLAQNYPGKRTGGGVRACVRRWRSERGAGAARGSTRRPAVSSADTPGLAIRDFWSVDDDTVVFVADPNTGNILNFNVGAGIDLKIPRSFWTRLASRYGTKFYWRDAGEGTAIINAVGAIDMCAREEPGRAQCVTIAGPLVE